MSLDRHAADVQQAIDDFLDRHFRELEVTPMLKCSTSLWSADLANLAAEIRRVDPYTERFHLDVADGHYVPSLLFFPDLVKALRKHTSKPFEVHLMTTDPIAWVEPFVEAGADGVIFCFDSLTDPGAAIKQVKDLGKFVGISLLVTEPVEPARPYWNTIDQVTIVGTPMGTKGTSMEPLDLRQDPRGPRRDREVFGPGRDPDRRRHPAQHRAADPRRPVPTGSCRARSCSAKTRRRCGNGWRSL